ncbi:MAG: hypothetical protein OEY20_14760 [Gemmatimonadota bacterium]|nr:hypothetical protein [Acidimicrobiia bacterium]MDH5198500.1 hypothetical protein [Gemmatimonadota bacterium]
MPVWYQAPLFFASTALIAGLLVFTARVTGTRLGFGLPFGRLALATAEVGGRQDPVGFQQVTALAVRALADHAVGSRTTVARRAAPGVDLPAIAFYVH